MRRPAFLAAVLAAFLAPSAEAKVAISFDEGVFAEPPALTAAAAPPGKPGRLYVVPGGSPRTGSGTVRRYMVEVEGGIRIGRRKFAERVHEILGAQRGWGREGRVSFRRVSSGRAHFRVTLATPATTDRLCAPFRTNGIFSCANGGRAVLNLARWRGGAAAYRGELRRYRIYLVNHEVGHLLGQRHRSCPRPGAWAPVMMQQTKGVGSCLANPWPLRYERAALPR